MPSFATINDFLQSELYIKPAPGNTLYHYTKIDTFKNIVNNQSLWMTDVRYANDAKEYRHGIEVIISVIIEYLTSRSYEYLLPEIFSDKNRQIVTKQLSLVLDAIKHHELSAAEGVIDDPVFIFCLSLAPDQLTQWTSYASEGGVAIGFDTETLRYSTQFKYGWSEGMSLLKCIYDRREQAQITIQILEMYLIDTCDLKEGNGSISEEGLLSNFEYQNQELIKNFKKLAPLFKDRYFQQEQEYRVIASVNRRYQQTPNSYPIELRTTRTMLVPYYNFTYDRERYGSSIDQKYLPGNDKNAQPIDFRRLIKSVKLGPCHDQSKAFHSLQLFIRKHIGSHCHVSRSDAPYIYR